MSGGTLKRYAKNIALFYLSISLSGLQREIFALQKIKERAFHKVFTDLGRSNSTWLDVIEMGEKGITNASKNRKFVENVTLRLGKTALILFLIQ